MSLYLQQTPYSNQTYTVILRKNIISKEYTPTEHDSKIAPITINTQVNNKIIYKLIEVTWRINSTLPST